MGSKKPNKKIDFLAIIRYLLFSLLFPVITSLVLVRNLPRTYSSLNARLKPIGIKVNSLPNSSNLEMLKDMAKKSFNKMFSNCKSHDEIMPISGRCIDSFGFHATIVESLETLFLLGMKEEYQTAVEFLYANLKCDRIEWVNRREFFSRFIGSLIGTYLLSSDSFFLNIAERCAQVSMRIDSLTKYPRPYHNIRNGSSKERMWINGTALQDISPGMPELMSLYHITNNAIYMDHVRRILKSLPRTKNVFYHSVLTIPRGLNGTTMRRMDGFTVGFYRNVAIAHGLCPLEESGFVLNKTEPLIQIIYDENPEIFYPLFEASLNSIGTKEQFVFPYLERLLNEALDNSKDLEIMVKKGSKTRVSGFRYDATLLRIMLFMSSNNRRESLKQRVFDSINMSYSSLSYNDSFVGLKHSNSGENKIDDVQHSSILGQWVKVGAVLLNGNEFSKNCVFNERGHILYNKMLLENIQHHIPNRCSRNGTIGHNVFC